MRRIHIIGAPGSGKTYVAGRLGAELGLPVHALDDLYFANGVGRERVRADPAVRDAELARIVEGDAWIVEGAYDGWVGPSFERAQMIVAMVPPVWLRDLRLVRRTAMRQLGLAPRGRSTVRLRDLLRWTHRHDDTFERVTEAIGGKPIVRCRSAAEVFEAVAVAAAVGSEES